MPRVLLGRLPSAGLVRETQARFCAAEACFDLAADARLDVQADEWKRTEHRERHRLAVEELGELPAKRRVLAGHQIEQMLRQRLDPQRGRLDSCTGQNS